jgi:hypothetical protein
MVTPKYSGFDSLYRVSENWTVLGLWMSLGVLEKNTTLLKVFVDYLVVVYSGIPRESVFKASLEVGPIISCEVWAAHRVYK